MEHLSLTLWQHSLDVKFSPLDLLQFLPLWPFLCPSEPIDKPADQPPLHNLVPILYLRITSRKLSNRAASRICKVLQSPSLMCPFQLVPARSRKANYLPLYARKRAVPR
jgi:hypothetical protein